jgi:hypothetical protein
MGGRRTFGTANISTVSRSPPPHPPKEGEVNLGIGKKEHEIKNNIL